ncbi:MAG TPA: redox-sensing transcriptional repressor Rex [Thermoleophilia bacterium]|nr:redox-sensing transcriptional repressor Rex [Thermoleophilia bacterium]
MRNVDRKDVPAVTVPRLALYLRKLRELRARGVERVSSKDLAEAIDLNAAQIRKDFSYFGEFGTRGVGYEVDSLIDVITRSLGLHRTWNVAIIGAGLLGTALARYRGFGEQGFRLVAMFDSSATVIGASYGEGRVRSVAELEEFCVEERVDIAVVTVPASEAQATIERLVAAGVRAILNFAPVRVHTPDGVLVRQVDLSSELMALSFHLDRESD